MTAELLTSIPFSLDFDVLLRRLHIPADSDDATVLAGMMHEAQSLAQPKAVCRVCGIDERGDDYLVIDGTRFTSRVLRVNLESTYRVFVFVATCGTELGGWGATINGLLERFWADTIMEFGLRSAMSALGEHITTRYQPGRTAHMNPGSLQDWPLSEQRTLFDLLGEAVDGIGVQLSDSYLMSPSKSVSGIRFATNDTFENCQLCPLENCPNRRAAFDPSLYERKYRVLPKNSV